MNDWPGRAIDPTRPTTRFERAWFWVVVMPAALLVLAMALVTLFVIVTTPVRAAELPPGIDCPTIRALVAHHGKAKALLWALKQGYTPAEIQAARRCLTQAATAPSTASS